MSTDKKMLRRSLTVLSLVGTLGLSSCVKDLDRFPTNGDTSQSVYSSADKTAQAFAKVYGAFGITGNGGKDEDGNGRDIAGIDEGASDFVRGLFNLQELPTEMAACAWGDNGVQDLHKHSWSASNEVIGGVYYRSLFQIKLASDFLKQTADKANDATIRTYRAEARFLRAYQYWVLMDLFGNPPFVDESTPTGKVYPRQISRAELFSYVEKELKAIEEDLSTPQAAVYGRANQATAWALLSRLYLNSEVYTGKARYAEAATYAEKVITSGKYSLKSDYAQLFMADNDQNNPEVLLSVNYDGQRSQNWGGMTFLINSSTSANAKAATKVNMGVNGGWGGNRGTKVLWELFTGAETKDKRVLITPGASLEISDLTKFDEGVYVYKFRNVTSTGANGKHGDHADTDFPLFRLAELYLNYAEAAIRDASVDQAKALVYLNKVRERAYGSNEGNYTTLPGLNEMLRERGRELYWEGQRRTDLIRFGKFTSGDYLWPWKGGVAGGQKVDDKYKLYPIPEADRQANPENIKQHPGY